MIAATGVDDLERVTELVLAVKVGAEVVLEVVGVFPCTLGWVSTMIILNEKNLHESIYFTFVELGIR